MEFQPDIVCGCSMGALVGAAYVTETLDALGSWAKTLGWKEVVGFFDISLTGGGVIRGERFIKLCRDYIGDITIESLSVPFATVATELKTGREVWFKSGTLLEAVRASMSLPGLFNPVQIEGKWFIDGGLVNPIPVSLCRAMGARFVIAVNLNSDIVGRHFSSRQTNAVQCAAAKDTHERITNLMGRKTKSFMSSLDKLKAQIGLGNNETPGFFDVLASSINIMQDRITRSRMAGDPADIILAPRLGHLGLLEFYRADEAIEEGKRCVQRAREAISQFL
jgi:NTE family protein